jgi:integrase
MTELEALQPAEAVEMYLTDKDTEYTEATLDSHRRRIKWFRRWFDTETEYDHLRELSGLDLHQFRVWRQGDLAPVTLKTQMDTVRVFLYWCRNIDAVSEDLPEKCESPRVSGEQNQRSDMLPRDRVEHIIDYLSRFHHASVQHVLWTLLWRTGIRVGAARAIDVEDYYPDEQYVQINHRPEQDTPLKNQYRGERPVSLRPDTCEVLDDYIRHNRHEVRDEYDRQPMFTSRQGRRAISNLREIMYRWSRPCRVGRDCPHGRNPETCEANESTNVASQCPSSKACHAMRRSSITHHLRQDVPVPVLSDRMNVSADVLDDHYDQRTEREKMEVRREYLDWD